MKISCVMPKEITQPDDTRVENSFRTPLHKLFVQSKQINFLFKCINGYQAQFRRRASAVPN